MSIQADTSGETREGQRIAKVMARAGLCSRRDAEQWIAEGRVSVNGEVLLSPAFNVSDADDVRVDGEPLRAAERTRLFLFHKPRGLVTTAKDPEGRPTIFGALPADLPRVVAVGRLDINSEGLLLLTNDGGLARVLELPATGWLRRYRVRAHGEITQEQLDGLRDGVSIDGIDYLGIEARFERQQGSNVWLTMGLREGKNREIKRVLEHMGLSVNRLIRVSFGPFELADLGEGDVVEVRTRVLRDQLGVKLAKQAGANFDAPAEAPAPAPSEPPRSEWATQRPSDDRRDRGERRDEPARKRKHVSVLRAEAREGTAGPRKRVARATTTDRKGREVKVERVSLANPPPAPPPRERRPAPRSAAGHDSRERAPRAEGGERRPRDAGRPPYRAPREDFASRPRAPRAAESFGDRRPRDAERAPRRTSGKDFAKRPRAPRAVEGSGERPSRDAARPPYRAPGEDFAKRPRAPRAVEGSGERPSRDAGRPPYRAPREDFAKRPRAPRAAESSGERPSRDAARPSYRAPREDFAKRPRPPRATESSGERRPRDADRPPRRTSGEDFDKRPRPPRAAESFGERRSRDAARPPYRAPREDFAKRPRAPRAAESSGQRRPRDADRPPRRAPGEAGPRSRDGKPPHGKGPPRGGKPGPRGGKPPRPR